MHECQTINRFSLSPLSLYNTLSFCSFFSLFIGVRQSLLEWFHSVLHPLILLLAKAPQQTGGTFLFRAKTKLFRVICFIWNTVLNNWSNNEWNKMSTVLTYAFTRIVPPSRVGTFPRSLSGSPESLAFKREQTAQRGISASKADKHLPQAGCLVSVNFSETHH